jgi:hypothetical protein
MGRDGRYDRSAFAHAPGPPHHLNHASSPLPLPSLPTPLRPSVRHRVHREVARPAGRSVDAAPVGELSSLLTVKTIKHLKRRNLTKVF